MRKNLNLVRLCFAGIFFLVSFLFNPARSFAQFSYAATSSENVAGSYADLGSSGTSITTRFAGGAMTFDEDNSSVQNIGFSFYFNGTAFTQFVLNTNGFIKLGNTNPGINNFNVLDSSALTNVIAAFNSNLRAGTATPEYRVATSGTAGAMICTIQFKNLRDASPSQYNNINFQIKLYETNNRIEFVYGSFTASAAAASEKQTIIGIKGSTVINSVNVTKEESTAWPEAAFIDGSYPPFTRFDHQNSVLPISGTTFIFRMIKDAKVETVYTLGKAPKPFGTYHHRVGVKLRNTGATDLVEYPVTLNITGANSFADTQYISLSSQDSTIVSFDEVSLWTSGTNILTVTVPPDDININNSATYTQEINDTLFSYADDSSPRDNKAGFGTNEGILFTNYAINGGYALVTGVRVYISNDPGNIGQTVWGVFWKPSAGDPPGTYEYSDSLVITAADTAKFKEFKFNNPVRMAGANYYVGLKQKASETPYYPVSYQNEGLPCRPNTFFVDSLPYGSLHSFNAGRLMIEEIVKIAPPLMPGYGTEKLLAWNFEGMNSPASAPAIIVHKKITSSNLLTRGPGAPPSPRINSFLTAGFGNDGISIANTDYFQFTVGVDAADTLSLTSIDIKYLSNIDSAFFEPNGVYSQFAYSLNGTDFALIDTPVLSGRSGDYGYRPNIDLSKISYLQDILNGTSVIFRYYVSGHTSDGVFGFITDFSAIPALAISGVIKTKRHIIMAAPVVPAGADFYLTDCNSTGSGSVDFTSIGTFPPGNVYLAKINNSQWAGDTSAITIGTLTSSANSGTINFTIPGYVKPSSRFGHTIWIESSSVPDAVSVPSEKFRITTGSYCYSPNSAFRSRQSGNWDDINTWEMGQSQYSDDTVWIASTFVPDKSARNVLIRPTDTVTITTPVGIHSIQVAGKIKLLKNSVHNGSITIYPNILSGASDWFYPMTIENSGILEIVSSAEFDSVIRRAPINSQEMMKIIGKIIVGNGSSLNGSGFYQLGTSPIQRIFWWFGGELEWNTTSTNGFIPTRYFFHNVDAATIRIINIGPGAFGGPGITTINGVLEINTPINVTGTVIVVANGYP